MSVLGDQVRTVNNRLALRQVENGGIEGVLFERLDGRFAVGADDEDVVHRREERGRLLAPDLVALRRRQPREDVLNSLAAATYPDGTVRPLIYIDDWDFNWQGNYTFADRKSVV